MSKTAKIVLGAVVAIIVVVALTLISTYNGLVRGREAVSATWAQVETQYQRRFDLIPNLVASVKSILKQEQTVFGELAEARTRYAGAKATEDKVAAANQLEGALGRLLVIVENYPQLKSAETVQTLMAQLEGAENRISVERGRNNETFKSNNVSQKILPRNLVAGWFGFAPRTMFEAVVGAAKVPAVDLNISK
ncbi:MAG: LemA family protein [Candidatus Magasanikbacteria bacterium]|nr:LemA family protein [Candidatus Magasanikbacteria bacterium]